MKFHSLRTSLVGTVFALIAAALLGSCGGGGASTNNVGGNLLLLPTNATFYAGMPGTMTIVGGRRPYRVISSEPGILPVPTTVDGNSFTLIPSNPGVIDTGIAVNELPTRSVTVSVTDAENGFAQGVVHVAQNFLTGYSIGFNSNCSLAGTATVAPQACAGSETALRIVANFNGALIGDRTYRLEVLRGPFSWVFPDGRIAGNTITVTTDHEGKAFAFFRVESNVPTQLGVFRIVDVLTGVSTEYSFIITGTPLAAQLEIIPNEFTFTGPDTATCGTGSAQFLVFDGLPPYRAFSSFAQVTVSPASTDAQPGIFTFNVNDPNTCLSNATIVVTDSRLARGTVTINTAPGTADPPPPPLRAIPASITLTCAALTGSTVVAGGADPTAAINAATTDPTLTITPAGRTVSVTFNPPSAGVTAVPPTVSSTVTLTDGTSVTNLTVRHPTDCI